MRKYALLRSMIERAEFISITKKQINDFNKTALLSGNVIDGNGVSIAITESLSNLMNLTKNAIPGISDSLDAALKEQGGISSVQEKIEKHVSKNRDELALLKTDLTGLSLTFEALQKQFYQEKNSNTIKTFSTAVFIDSLSDEKKALLINQLDKFAKKEYSPAKSTNGSNDTVFMFTSNAEKLLAHYLQDNENPIKKLLENNGIDTYIQQEVKSGTQVLINNKPFTLDSPESFVEQKNELIAELDKIELSSEHFAP